MLNCALTKSAAKFLKQLPAKQFRQVTISVLKLLENPHPHDSKALKNTDFLRVDVGEYRIIYRLEEATVMIAEIGKRNDDDVYRKFARKKY